MLPDIAESPGINEISAKDLQDIEDKFENFVILVNRKALEKYESYKKEGRVKGSDKPHKDTIPVEIVGAISLAAVGLPFGYIGTGASIGATVVKFAYDLIHKYFHRKKAKDIVRTIEKFCIDETEILGLFASIGADIFQACEYQLRPLVETDLQKVAHDVVIGVYNEIKPETWDKDECKSIALSAKSATGKGAKKSKDLLSKAGIYDGKNYFVSDNTDSLEYGFRQPFKNEVVDEKVWRLAKDHEIGSFQPQYFITDDMTTRVKENAISKTIAANPPMAAKQNAVYSADARDALKENRALAQEVHAKVSDVSEQLEIEKTQADLLVAKNQEMNSSFTKYEVEAYTKLAKSANLGERLKTVAERDEKYRELVQTVASKCKEINASLTRIAEDQQPKCKVDIALKADEPDLSYVQRNKPYGKLKELYDNHPRDILGSSRFAVVVGEKGVGKSDLARSFANNEFKDKHVLWIEATNEKTLKAAFIAIAKEMEVGGIVENKDSKDIQKEIYSRLDPDQSLIVFDDVDEFEDIKPFMPCEVLLGERSPFVLITSKNDKDWKEGHFYYNCDIIELGPFDDSECLQFFKDSLQDGGYDVMEMGDTDEAIIELGRELNSIPAELVAAVNNIFYKKCTLTDYLNSIRNKPTSSREASVADLTDFPLD